MVANVANMTGAVARANAEQAPEALVAGLLAAPRERPGHCVDTP
jgi:hypothetical protein